MARSIYQLHVSLERAGSSESDGPGRRRDYRFCQDGREFGRNRDDADYREDDSRFSLRYCLCCLGDTLEYRDGPWRYSIVLEAVRQVDGRFPWRLMDGAGSCPGAGNGSSRPPAGAAPSLH